jgi:hypothetical protein
MATYKGPTLKSSLDWLFPAREQRTITQLR